jgi:ATP-binding cassette, subfamily B, bacterial
MKATTRDTIKIYWKHSLRYKWLLTTIIISVVAANLFDLCTPFFYKIFFDQLAQSIPTEQGMTELLKNIWIITSLGFASWFCWRINSFTNIRFEASVIRDLANTCFYELHHHAYSFFSNNFTGSLVKRGGRFVDAFERIMDQCIFTIIPLAVRIAFIIITLCILNSTIGLSLLVWTATYLVIIYCFTIYKLQFEKQGAEADSALSGFLADTITNSTNIKLTSAREREYVSFQNLAEKRKKISVFTWDLSAYVDAIQGFMMVVLEFIVLYLSLQFWKEGKITIGDFVMYQSFVMQLFMRLWDFSRSIRHIYRGFADANEMTEILLTPWEIKDKPIAQDLNIARGQIEMKAVDFGYTGTRMVISQFNLTIQPGEKVGIVGPSGAGKSTLVALLLRLYDVQEGHIFIDDIDVANVTQNSLRNNISLVPQDPILFHRSLKENIAYGKPDATMTEIIGASKAAHCHEFISVHQNEYDTYVGERGIKLSGGERQRIAIARAILKNAPILILDEATSSLDSESEKYIQQSFDILMKGKTTIVIAHRLSTIMKMDRIIVLENGKIVEEGNHNLLLQKENSLYKKLWNIQAGNFLV